MAKHLKSTLRNLLERKKQELCGIGGETQEALHSAGIKLYGGVSGKADEAVEALLNGTLGYNPNVHCDHHGHEHGGERQYSAYC